MTAPDRGYLQRVAAECVRLVALQFGRHLDWSLASLAEIDAVCEELLADGPLSDERLDLWWKLIGAYTGEVLIRGYAGEWVAHEQSTGAPAVSALGITAFPFATTNRVLHAEPGKSLASLGRVLPFIAERSQADSPGERLPKPPHPYHTPQPLEKILEIFPVAEDLPRYQGEDLPPQENLPGKVAPRPGPPAPRARR